MTTAAGDAHSQAGSGVLTTDKRRVRLDLIGLGAVLIAGLGLAATIVVTRTPASESTRGPTVSVAVPSAPQTRDRWYLDKPAATALPIPSQMRDRWYLDGRAARDIPKDRWYSDPQYPTP
jgi:hypothetical protein